MSKSLDAGQALRSYQVTAAECYLMKTTHFGKNIIVDDVFLYDNCVQSLLLLWRCSLQVFIHHRASIKLKKFRIMTDALEFVGILGSPTSDQQRIMKEICPELAPLLTSEGLIFMDLKEAQMCLHEAVDMILYLQTFEAALPMSASISLIQLCLAVFYSIRIYAIWIHGQVHFYYARNGCHTGCLLCYRGFYPLSEHDAAKC
jgi:hypothetical protein